VLRSLCGVPVVLELPEMFHWLGVPS